MDVSLFERVTGRYRQRGSPVSWDILHSGTSYLQNESALITLSTLWLPFRFRLFTITALQKMINPGAALARWLLSLTLDPHRTRAAPMQRRSIKVDVSSRLGIDTSRSPSGRRWFHLIISRLTARLHLLTPGGGCSTLELLGDDKTAERWQLWVRTCYSTIPLLWLWVWQQCCEGTGTVRCCPIITACAKWCHMSTAHTQSSKRSNL